MHVPKIAQYHLCTRLREHKFNGFSHPLSVSLALFIVSLCYICVYMQFQMRLLHKNALLESSTLTIEQLHLSKTIKIRAIHQPIAPRNISLLLNIFSQVGAAAEPSSISTLPPKAQGTKILIGRLLGAIPGLRNGN